MRLCLDASVAVASERPKELGHAASRVRVDRVLAGTDEIVVPAPLIQAVAMRTRLRAADAAYAWVAGRANVPLVTLDGEVSRRAASVCAVEPP